MAPLRAGQALATGGTTLYSGGGFLGRVCTVLDFGFLFKTSKDGVLGCYAANNAAFVRELRCAVRPPDGPMRCHCYAHAQTLKRIGKPVLHVPEALVWHEFPPLFSERLRRGYDLVAESWVDPTLKPERWHNAGWWKIYKLYRQNLRLDWQRIVAAPPELHLSGFRKYPAIVLAALLRLIDMAGARRAIRDTPKYLDAADNLKLNKLHPN